MSVAMTEATEAQLIARAQDALSHCRWVVGECAALWTKRYSRGRTDADFGNLVGLTADQVFQRRRVWERFGADREEYPRLKWSHFYSALNWDDAVECLLWAVENEATVAEMKVWRRARRGEDLNEQGLDDQLHSGSVQFLPTELEPVLEPSDEGGIRANSIRSQGASGETVGDRLVGVARQSDGSEPPYSPYRADAMQVPAASGGSSSTAGSAPVEPISTEQLVKKLTSQFERCVKILTPEFAQEFRNLPEGVRSRFVRSLRELTAKASDLM